MGSRKEVRKEKEEAKEERVKEQRWKGKRETKEQNEGEEEENKEEGSKEKWRKGDRVTLFEVWINCFTLSSLSFPFFSFCSSDTGSL